MALSSKWIRCRKTLNRRRTIMNSCVPNASSHSAGADQAAVSSREFKVGPGCCEGIKAELQQCERYVAPVQLGHRPQNARASIAIRLRVARVRAESPSHLIARVSDLHP